MNQLRDYSSMLGLLSKWDKDNFIEQLALYKAERDKVWKQENDLGRYRSKLNINIAYFEKQVERFEYSELKKNFVLKAEHKLCLQNLEFSAEGILGLRSLHENFIELIFLKDKYEISDKEQNEYLEKYRKLINELPFAIAELAKH